MRKRKELNITQCLANELNRRIGLINPLYSISSLIVAVEREAMPYASCLNSSMVLEGKEFVDGEYRPINVINVSASMPFANSEAREFFSGKNSPVGDVISNFFSGLARLMNFTDKDYSVEAALKAELNERIHSLKNETKDSFSVETLEAYEDNLGFAGSSGMCITYELTFKLAQLSLKVHVPTPLSVEDWPDVVDVRNSSVLLQGNSKWFIKNETLDTIITFLYELSAYMALETPASCN